MDFPNESIIILLSAFYIGAILGNNVALFWIKVTEKKKILLASIVLSTISCIILMLMPGNYWMITASRFVAGFAHSLVYITSLVHASEIAIPKLRSLIILSLHQHLGGSFFTTILMMATSEFLPFAIYDLAPYFLLIFVFRGLFFLCAYFIESPVFLIQNNRNNDAMHSIIKLRNENVESWETHRAYNELKSMIAESEKFSNSVWRNGNLRPLLVVVTSLLVYLTSYNFTLNSVRLSLISGDQKTRFIAPWVTFGVRLVFGKVIVYVIDRLNTRFIQLFSGFVAGFSLIICGLIHTMTYGNEIITLTGFVIYETLGIMGVSYISILVSSEAFPPTKKCESLCMIYNLENMVHLTSITITTEFYKNQEIFFMFIFGTTIITLTSILYFIMPETKMLNLKQCVNAYKKVK